ncbi:MAG: hypothetical protein IPL27_06005 [Lewinellaceae bacterium]|nr:hypothetical protein [Lewinellaceae bacterium]
MTRTGSMSVPIAVTPGRSGFAPQLMLSYDSGAGNGAFGLGWDVGLRVFPEKHKRIAPIRRFAQIPGRSRSGQRCVFCSVVRRIWCRF